MKLPRALSHLFLFLTTAPMAKGQTNPAGGAPRNGALVDSPWPTFHGGPARQASTTLLGPVNSQPEFVVRYFVDDTGGQDLFTSPWHSLSDRRYTDSSTARTLWGVSLQYIYKYVIDGDRFEYVDSFRIINVIPYITWNFLALADGRVVVTMPSGLNAPRNIGNPCYGNDYSLIVFRDGPESTSPLECLEKFELSPDIVESACGFRDIVKLRSAGPDVLFTGEFLITLVRRVALRLETWVAIVDNGLNAIKTCERVTEDGAPSNASPMEVGSTPDETIVYIATDLEVLSVSYKAATNELSRVLGEPIQYRSGRTGTTPTLLGFGNDDRWILSIDARCAVENPLTGSILCDDDNRPSELVAMPLPLGSGPIRRVELPGFIDTVENSPAVAGNDIVVCDYSGYTPDGEVDGQPDFAMGVVKLSYNPTTKEFQIDWTIPDVQCSGIPTISTTANLVYFSGATPNGKANFYGVRLNGDDRGEVVVRRELGSSTGDRGIFDAGNSCVANDDGSMIFPGGSSLVRVSDSPLSLPPPGGGRICFSGKTTVVVLGKGTIAMEDLELGDRVQVNKGVFEPVYSFCKKNNRDRVTFLEMHAAGLDGPLELSPNHLLFIHSNKGVWKSIRASDVSPGDRLLLLSNRDLATVTKIEVVRREGFYAPLTYSGTIAANGALVSVYAALSDGPLSNNSPFLHWKLHFLHSHHRLVCKVSFAICKHEVFTEEGMARVSALSLWAYEWWWSQACLIQALVATIVVGAMLVLYIVEALIECPALSFVAFGTWLFYRRAMPAKVSSFTSGTSLR